MENIKVDKSGRTAKARVDHLFLSTYSLYFLPHSMPILNLCSGKFRVNFWFCFANVSNINFDSMINSKCNNVKLHQVNVRRMLNGIKN